MAKKSDRKEGSAGILPSTRRTTSDSAYYSELSAHLLLHSGDSLRRLLDFSKFVPRQNLTAFLTKYEIFKLVVDVPGSLVECGVFHG